MEAAGLAAGAEVAVGGRLHGRHARVVRIEVGVVHRPGGRGRAGPGRVGVVVPDQMRVEMGVRTPDAKDLSPALSARESARPVAAAFHLGAVPSAALLGPRAF